MKKITTAVLGAGLAGMLALSGCSSNTSNNDGGTTNDSSTAETTNPTEQAVEVPASVQGPEWCADVYSTYTASVSTPQQASELLAAAAAKAGNEQPAQQALQEFSDFLAAQEGSPDQPLPEASLDQFTTLDNNLNTQFSTYCGGKTVMETLMEQFPEAFQQTDPAQGGTPAPETPVAPDAQPSE